MEEEKIQEEKLVFYSGGKRKDAEAFCDANNDYAFFWDIFDKDFQKDFGNVPMDSEVTAACSKAMALHAEGETRVFGDAAGKCISQGPCGSASCRIMVIQIKYGQKD
jgi:hypothetical protein